MCKKPRSLNSQTASETKKTLSRNVTHPSLSLAPTTGQQLSPRSFRKCARSGRHTRFFSSFVRFYSSRRRSSFVQERSRKKEVEPATCDVVSSPRVSVRACVPNFGFRPTAPSFRPFSDFENLKGKSQNGDCPARNMRFFFRDFFFFRRVCAPEGGSKFGWTVVVKRWSRNLLRNV